MVGVEVAKRNSFTKLGRLDLSRAWTDEVRHIGRIRGVDIHISASGWNDRHVVCSIDDGGRHPKIVMTIDMEFESSLSRKSTPFYSVAYTAVDYSFQGFGIAPKIYREILRRVNMGIVSGDSQSAGGQGIWKKLIAEKSVSVLTFRTHRSLREVELDDFGRVNADDPSVNIWDQYAPDEDTKPWRLVAFNENRISI